LAEIALVRMCRVADLQVVSQVVQALRAGNLGSVTLNLPAVGVALPAPAIASPAPAAASAAEPAPASPALKKNEVVDDSSDESPELLSGKPLGEEIEGTRVDSPIADSESPSVSASLLPAANDAEIVAAWRTMLSERTDILSDNAREGTPSMSGAQLVLTFTKRYNFRKQSCERGNNIAQLEQWLEERIGRRIKIATALSEEPESMTPATPVTAAPTAASRQRKQEIEQHPLVKKAMETFAARVVGVIDVESGQKT
jgi:hypothetical protein